MKGAKWTQAGRNLRRSKLWDGIMVRGLPEVRWPSPKEAIG